LAEAKALENSLKAKNSFLVSDIRKAREAEGKVMTIGKQLQVAREYVLELNKKQYEGKENFEYSPGCLRPDPDIDIVQREEMGMRKSLKALTGSGTVRKKLGSFSQH